MRWIAAIAVIALVGGLMPARAQRLEAPPQPPNAGARETPAPVSITPAPPKSAKPQPSTEVSMSFDKADINSVIKFLSVASGVPIVCDPDLKGNVTIVSQKQIPLSDAFEVVNSALRVRGYTMVGTLESKVVRVMALKKAVADMSVVQSGMDTAVAGSGDNFVTQVIPLEYVSAQKLKDDLKPFVSDDQASCTAIATTNMLVITDTASNVRRIAQVIEALDKDTSDVIKVEIYQCKHSSADTLVETLNKIFQIKPAGPQMPQPGRPPEGGQPQPTVKTEEGVVSLKGEIRIASDPRTNSLIISASEEKLRLVLDVIAKLDVDTRPEVQSEVIPLKYADAGMVADQLNKLFEQPQRGGTTTGRRYDIFFPYYGDRGGTQPSGYAGLKRNVVVADVRTNSLIVTATEQNMREFKDMIAKLDAPDVLNEITQLFPLKYANAVDLADTLNRLFRGETRRRTTFFDFIFDEYSNRTREGGPLEQLRDITVVAEEKTNTLMITGPPQAFNMVREIIERVDRRTAQVFIEVAIVDVTLTDDTRFGVEWSWTSTSTRPSGNVIEQEGGTDFGLSNLTGGLRYSVISDNMKALLQALEVRSDVKVYSTPQITTADNVEAKISIGRREPYITSEDETASGTLRRSVDFLDANVSLTVTPHVNESSDVIALDVHQTIDEIIGREEQLNAPIVANREALTSITVKDGQTIVIGGIIKENHEWTIRGVPFLSRLPLIGHLFRSKTRRNDKSELMVFLTPHILKDDDAVTTVTKETEGRLSNPPPGLIEKKGN